MASLLALRKFVERIYKALSARQQLIAKSLSDGLAETGFEVERLSPSTLSWQVAYGTALKLILYSLVERRLNLPSLGELRVDELGSAFEKAHKASGLQALKPSWIDVGLTLVEATELKDLFQEVVEALEKRSTDDVLGQLYEELMPQEERRRLGEFYTPRPIAEFMVKWAVKRPDDFVLDPAVGSGTFLVEALCRLEALGCGAHRASSQLYGVDINPLAVLMTTINILRRVPSSRPRIFSADFLKLTPLTAPIIDLDRTAFEVIACNPPYTRHHELLPSYKEEIARMVEQEGGEPVSQLSSIYLHFFIHACSFLREGGRLAFITPSEWMEAEYGLALRRFLAKRMCVESIVLFEEKALAFPGVLTRACITLASKQEASERALLVKLSSWPSVEELIEAVESREERDYKWGRAKLRDLTSIDPAVKWSQLFGAWALKSAPPFMVGLGQLAKVSRGIATGANEFFTLSEPEVKRHGIEGEYLKPVVPGARYLKGCDFTKSDWERLRSEGKKAYLLYCFKRKEELRGARVLKYIEGGESKGFNKRYLTCHRRVWYWVERREPPDAFLIYMFRSGLRFIYNRAGAYALNTLHYVYFDERVKREEASVKAVLAYLNSTPAFDLAKEVLRVYGGGMYKLEPGEAEKLPCINPLAVPASQRESLAALFDELCLAIRRGGAEEGEVRALLDSEVRKLLHA